MMRNFWRRSCNCNNVSVWITYNDDGPYHTYADLSYVLTMPRRIYFVIKSEEGVPASVPRKIIINVERAKLQSLVSSGRTALSENTTMRLDSEHKNRAKLIVNSPRKPTLVVSRISMRRLGRFLERTEVVMPTARVHEVCLFSEIPNEL